MDEPRNARYRLECKDGITTVLDLKTREFLANVIHAVFVFDEDGGPKLTVTVADDSPEVLIEGTQSADEDAPKKRIPLS